MAHTIFFLFLAGVVFLAFSPGQALEKVSLAGSSKFDPVIYLPVLTAQERDLWTKME